MEPKVRTQYERQLELSQNLQSLMAHPQWQLLIDLIEDERKFHTNKSKSPDFRQDPSQYGNIVRAMDAADAIDGILIKFNTIIKNGKKAQEEIDVADGNAAAKPR